MEVIVLPTLLTLQILLTKIYNRRFLANPTEKYARQWSVLPPAWSSTGEHICQSDLLGIAKYINFVSDIYNVCANLFFKSLAYKLTDTAGVPIPSFLDG